VVNRCFEPRFGQTKDYEIGNCCISRKHALLRRKCKDWLAGNQDSVSERTNFSTQGLFVRWATTIKIHLSMVDLYKVDIIIISSNVFSPWQS